MNARQLRRAERRQAHENRLEANRANAAHSTGPSTEEGKAVSSQNNSRHGLSGAFCVLLSEDAAAFEQLASHFAAEHNPQSQTETLLVADLARHYWLVQRAIRLQETCLANPDLNEKQFALYLRYQTTHQRAYHRCLNDLLKLQKQKASEQRGFESQTQRAAAEQRRTAAEQRREDQHHWQKELHERKMNTAFRPQIGLKTRSAVAQCPVSEQNGLSGADSSS